MREDEVYPPVKCSECGTWWRGMEHRCGPASPPSSGSAPWTPGPTGPKWHPSLGGGGGGHTTTTQTGRVYLVNNTPDTP